MVYLHGGGFVSGANHHYNATRLAVEGDIVVVSVNYRLGVFGFFAHPDLPGSGAFGIGPAGRTSLGTPQCRCLRRRPRQGDALRAVRGRAEHVRSAHFSHRQGLFQQAILQSGSCGIHWPKNGYGAGSPVISPWGPPQEVHELARLYTTGHGCDTVDCLRKIPAAGERGLLADPLSSLFSRPVYGTSVLPEHPAKALAGGRFHKVPVMNGHTRDEHRLMIAWTYDPLITAEQYRELITDSFGNDAPQVAARYPLASFASPSEAWSAIATDSGWACPTLADDRHLAKRTTLYGFEFADRTAPWIYPEPPPFPLGAYHASELPYLFPDPKITPNSAQRRLSKTMIGYWARFAHTGTPNAPGSPQWTRLTSSAATVQSLSPEPGGVRPTDLGVRHNCDLWQSLS